MEGTCVLMFNCWYIFWSPRALVLWVLVIWRYRRSNVCWCWMFDAYFEALVLLFCGVWFFGGIRQQTCIDVQMFMHILKPKSFTFVGFGLWKVWGQICVNFECVEAYCEPHKALSLWGWILLKVKGVKCLLILSLEVSLQGSYLINKANDQKNYQNYPNSYEYLIHYQKNNSLSSRSMCPHQ